MPTTALLDVCLLPRIRILSLCALLGSSSATRIGSGARATAELLPLSIFFLCLLFYRLLADEVLMECLALSLYFSHLFRRKLMLLHAWWHGRLIQADCTLRLRLVLKIVRISILVLGNLTLFNTLIARVCLNKFESIITLRSRWRQLGLMHLLRHLPLTLSNAKFLHIITLGDDLLLYLWIARSF